MTAEDEEGGEEELREILEAMGYSSSLQLDQVRGYSMVVMFNRYSVQYCFMCNLMYCMCEFA